jgi:hypothetical protein
MILATVSPTGAWGEIAQVSRGLIRNSGHGARGMATILRQHTLAAN